MNYLKPFFILFLVLIFSQCKKYMNAEVPAKIPILDTLKPLSYYPVFPGSFWTYLNENNDTVKYYTLDKYTKNCYAPGESDTVFVPFISKSNYVIEPVYQYDEISNFRPGAGIYRRTPILSEVIGAQFRRGGNDARYGDHRPIAVVKGKFKINNDTVLILRVTSYFYNQIIFEHYTKNVGLSLTYETDTITNDTISKLRLINYHINK